MAATLLLADDSVTIQRVIALTFANEPVRVVADADGPAALARMETQAPDIVLVDVALAGLDGYDVVARMKASPRLAHVPVLMLTGAFEPIDEGRARQVGCDGVLVKPLEPQHVIATVRGLLAGQRPAHLWPIEMPRVDEPTMPPQPTGARAPETTFDDIHEPGPLPAPAAVEAVFETGLDDLDRAFSRLDPMATPSKLDADVASDFQRDIHELRATPPAFEPLWEESAARTPPVSHLPVEEAEPFELLDLGWDLPAPNTVIDAVPLPQSFPVTPPVAAPQIAPAPAPMPVAPPVPVAPPTPVPVAPPVVAAPPPPPPAPVAPPAPVIAVPPPAPPVVEPPAPPPAPVAPVAPPAPPSLATAFSALLAAERAVPSRASSTHVSGVDLEDVMRRVMTRMTEEMARLIREEMERRDR